MGRQEPAFQPTPLRETLRPRVTPFGQILTEPKFWSAGLAPASAEVWALPQGRIAPSRWHAVRERWEKEGLPRVGPTCLAWTASIERYLASLERAPLGATAADIRRARALTAPNYAAPRVYYLRICFSKPEKKAIAAFQRLDP
jgi:hypothetical protein